MSSATSPGFGGSDDGSGSGGEDNLPITIQFTDSDGDFLPLTQTDPESARFYPHVSQNGQISLYLRSQFGHVQIPLPSKVTAWLRKAAAIRASGGSINRPSQSASPALPAPDTKSSAAPAARPFTGFDGSDPAASVMNHVASLLQLPASSITNTTSPEDGMARLPPLLQPMPTAGPAPVPVAAPVLMSADDTQCGSCTFVYSKLAPKCPVCSAPNTLYTPPQRDTKSNGHSTSATGHAGSATASAAAAAVGSPPWKPVKGGGKSGGTHNGGSGGVVHSTVAAAAVAGTPVKGAFTTATADRKQSLHACKKELWCENKHCDRFHGKYEPRQEARYTKEKADHSSNEKSPGMVACAFALIGCCPHYKSTKCPYRHFTHVLPITSEQRDRIETAMVGVPGLELSCPIPIVVQKPALGSYPDFNPAGSPLSMRVALDEPDSPAAPVVVSHRAKQPTTIAPWANRTQQPLQIEGVPSQAGAPTPIDSFPVQNTGPAPTPAPLAPAPVVAPAPEKQPVATAAPPVPLTPAAQAKTAQALRAIVAALLVEPNKTVHVTALGSNLRSHGIASWNREFAPDLGSLSEFIARNTKVLSISAQSVVSLSAAANLVANKSLAESKSGSAAPTTTSAAGGVAPAPLTSAQIAATIPHRPTPSSLRAPPGQQRFTDGSVHNKAVVFKREALKWGYEDPLALIIDILLHEPNYTCRLPTLGSRLQDYGCIWSRDYAEEFGPWMLYARKLSGGVLKFDHDADTLQLVKTGPRPGFNPSAATAAAPAIVTHVARKQTQNHVRRGARRAAGLGYPQEPLATMIDIALEAGGSIAIPALGGRLQNWSIQWQVQYASQLGSVQDYIKTHPKIFRVSYDGPNKTPTVTLLIDSGKVGGAASSGGRASGSGGSAAAPAPDSKLSDEDSLQICTANDACSLAAAKQCPYVHGRFDEGQIVYLQHPEPALPGQAFSGKLACKYFLGPKRYCKLESKCKNRHLIPTAPLNPQQKAVVEAAAKKL